MKLFIATPCYRSDPQAAFVWAASVATALNVSAIVQVPMSTNLTTSQAQVVQAFLKSDCDLFFMREDDVFVEAEVLRRMIEAKVPAIVAPYLVRNSDPPRMDVIFSEDGGYEVLWAGVGCMLVTREVLQTMWSRYHGELQYLQDGVELVALFRDFFAQRDDGVQLVKLDHAFWFRVRECGFRVEALDDVIVNHAGNVSHFKKKLLDPTSLGQDLKAKASKGKGKR